MLTLNQQPPEKPVAREDGALEVVDVWLTIQGEGPYLGTPAVFVRTAGCNFQCPQCDTEYTLGRRLEAADDLVTEVRGAGRDVVRLCVLTGGEPFRQRCSPFVRALLAEGWTVQVETNGTLWDPDLPWGSPRLCVVCSPKAGSVNKQLAPWVNAYKYVLSADDAEPDGLPATALGGVRPARPHGWCPGGPGPAVYVQPLDEQDPARNQAHTDAAVASCLKHGFKLCLQLHKIVGLA